MNAYKDKKKDPKANVAASIGAMSVEKDEDIINSFDDTTAGRIDKNIRK